MHKVIVETDIKQGKINKNIYGHFAEHLGRGIYEGIWVGEDSSIPNTRGIRNDVLDALKAIEIPVLRWPGGCFADEYHWKNGVGTREHRKRMVNTHWGGVTESNHFGTHEFLMLCELVGAEPYICGNVGSGTVQEMSEWIEYLTLNGESPMANWRAENGRYEPWQVTNFGVGNENWGCGGNMRPEYYADLYKQFQTYIRDYSGNKLYKIAGGASDDNFHWTDVLMREAAPHLDGLSLHYYTIPGEHWHAKGSATDFSEDEWNTTMEKALLIEELIEKHGTIMDKYDPEKRVGMIIDEWGTWFDVEPGSNPGFLYQQNTIRDALVAGASLNIFNSHCDRVQMANIAQTINVLQAMVLTEREKMILTPTYHVFNMFKVHQDADKLALHLETETIRHKEKSFRQISASASQAQDGRINISLCNLDHQRQAKLHLDFRGAQFSEVTGRILTAESKNAHNTFEEPENVHPEAFNDITNGDNGLELQLPAMSIVVLRLKET